jgi:ATP-dependent DNA helicase RecG
MSPLEWFEIGKEGESETQEFKKSTSLIKEITETICAFANNKGGTIYVGISDEGQVLGQTISDDTLKNLTNAILLNTEPKLYPEISTVIIEEKTCIRIRIGESPFKPHYAFGKPLTRVGPTNQRMSQSMYELMLLQRLNGYGFDYQIAEGATLAEIEETAVFELIETANLSRNINENLLLPLEVLLEKMGLLREGKLTRAALLLFGKKPSRYFLGNFEIMCGAFNEDEGYNFFLDNKELNENLFSNYNAALSFILRHINSSYEKGPPVGIRRYEIPIPVLQEALVNMIVHRDYRTGIKSYIEIRPDYILFSNPGFLFRPAITIEKLVQAHSSKPGNALIARAFFWRGLFENWGTGTLKIMEGMKNAGKRTPEFTFGDDHIFRLKLYRN